MSRFIAPFAAASAISGAVFSSNLRADYSPQRDDTASILAESESPLSTGISISVAALLAVGGMIAVRHRLQMDKVWMEEIRRDLPTFKRFIAELDAFNRLHSKLSGMSHSEAKRPGAAASFPELSHDQAFEKAWNAVAAKVGLQLLRREERGLDSTGMEVLLHSAFILVLAEPRRTGLFLAVCAEEAAKGTFDSPLRRALVLLGEGAELSLLAGLKTGSIRQMKGAFLYIFEGLEFQLEAIGRKEMAQNFKFYRELFKTSPEAAKELANFELATFNRALNEGEYWIDSCELIQAYTATDRLMGLVRKDPRLASAAERVLTKFDVTVDLLEYQALLPSRDKEGSDPATEDDDSSGGVLIAEEEGKMAAESRAYQPELFTQLRARLGKFRSELTPSSARSKS